MSKGQISYSTYRLLSLSLVSLHFKLQFVHQVLKSGYILLILLSLKQIIRSIRMVCVNMNCCINIC